MPEFQGRQVVTLHNQRDFLFFRRHRYAFRSVEKVQLQEIGPRFTLKLRSVKKGLPAVKNLGEVSKPLEFDNFDEKEEKGEQKAAKEADEAMDEDGETEENADQAAGQLKPKSKVVPPKDDEYQWVWKVRHLLFRLVAQYLKCATAGVGNVKTNLLPIVCGCLYLVRVFPCHGL